MGYVDIYKKFSFLLALTIVYLLLPTTTALSSSLQEDSYSCKDVMGFVYGGPLGDGSKKIVTSIINSISDGITEKEADRYSESFLIAGKRYGIDPLLLVAVAKVESNFNREAVSYAGAIGIMQIMPFTGKELAKQENIYWKGKNTLFISRINILIGAYYLNYLLDMYSGNIHDALTAYNMGFGRLNYLKTLGVYKGKSIYSEKVMNIYRNLVENNYHFHKTFTCDAGINLVMDSVVKSSS